MQLIATLEGKLFRAISTSELTLEDDKEAILVDVRNNGVVKFITKNDDELDEYLATL